VRAFTDTLRIGGEPNSNARTFNGRVDEVAIFDSALTGAQLQGLYQQALGVIPPTIVGQPAPRTEYAGSSVTFTLGASGTAPLAYQWQKDDVNLTDGGRISGATTGTLTLTSLTAADQGSYRAIVSNAQGTATSEGAALTVLAQPPMPAEGTFGGAVLGSGALRYWRFNESGDPSTGNVQAFDYASGSHALYGVAAANGVSGVTGPRPSEGFAEFEESNAAFSPTAGAADSWVTAPALGIDANEMTILAWINPNSLVANAGIVFARAGQPATGLNLNGAGNLGYHWLDAAATYSWDSGLTPPIGQWSLAALSVQPDRATVHLINPEGAQSAVNTNAHAVRTFTDAIRIGGDPNNVNRNFDGRIDEVAIYNRALSAEQIQSVYNGEAPEGPVELTVARAPNGEITISWNAPGTLQSTTALQGAATSWANETTTGMTFTVPADGRAKFFRLLQ
jgi:hypothetical protein